MSCGRPNPASCSNVVRIKKTIAKLLPMHSEECHRINESSSATQCLHHSSTPRGRAFTPIRQICNHISFLFKKFPTFVA